MKKSITMHKIPFFFPICNLILKKFIKKQNQLKKNKLFYTTILLNFLLISWAKSEAQSIKMPDIGYFALPVSQQPGPFISFGQTLIAAHDAQIYLNPSYLKLEHGQQWTATAVFVYGVSDETDLQLALPVALQYRQDDHRSSGLEDFSLQLEHAFYQGSKANYQEQATFVTSLTFPSGDGLKNPPTGYGAPSFFDGITFNRTYVHWTTFVSLGGIITTSNDAVHYGESLLYQYGLGHILSSKKNHHIVTALLELDGQWSQKNRFFGLLDPNSGGNVVYVTPSLWYSNQKFIVQAGISLPVIQQLNGEQAQNRYFAMLSVGWTFN